MKRITAGILSAFAACLATPAQAQICAGFPTAEREFTIGASVDFPERLNPRGAEASWNVPGPFAVAAGASVVSVEGDDGILAQSVSAGASYALLGDPSGARGQVCPLAALGYTTSDDLGSAASLSLGVGLGLNLSASRTFGIYPYAAPQVVLSRSTFNGDTDGSTDLAVTGGVLVGVGALWVGPTVAYLVEDGAEPVFGIRGGFRP